LGFVLLSPLFGAIALAIKLDSPGPVFFRQERIGRRFQPFLIYKFRTMVQEAPRLGAPITSGDDRRVTRVGRFLRRMKLDELPQLINVLRGHMSLVGPRPEIRRYVELFQKDYEEILTVRPGITDPASVAFADEAEQLGRFSDPEQEYVARILPKKIAFSKDYVRNASFFGDLSLIFRTLARILA
jgi:lipopolysaccharide/colanic/teichoic acid biosynthesis glycosyltransferase